ncbi:hypothetical protein MLD38_013824 [Melastoma candidum]|uniref:Uncharacterized protein n=1 Tax=Melastoma candidum TaxID=119954 RepID=A0ACB9REH6_9MYRT|nr:hypothetical protein MLD38_013824 [Melastoma candidum]
MTISVPPSPSPSPSPSSLASPPVALSFLIHRHSSSSSLQPPQSNKSSVNFSPPLIAMVVIVATAFLAVSYSRLLSRHLLRFHDHIRRCHRRLPPSSTAYSSSSPPFIDSPSSDGLRVYSPCGLDDGVIKALPLSLFTCSSSRARDCAVCLLEFERGHDYVRTLPNCAHSFHVDCIDMWLRSHANCPICRAGIFSSSPFTPLMASRIRPSLDDDDAILNDLIVFEEIDLSPEHGNPNASILNNYNGTGSSHVTNPEIIEEELSRPRAFLLKRSYSFGCERGGTTVSAVEEAVTASPWRWRRGWKRMSPFGMIGKGSSAGRVFSLRYSNHINCRKSSPVMFRRRSGVFFPLSESRFSIGLRRGKFVGSPMMSVGLGVGGGGGRWSSLSSSASRLRCGDPEALLSPDRFSGNRT